MSRNLADDATLDAVFGALSSRTRRGLLARLSEGPASVTELAAPLPMSLPAVSKHLRVLEASGLVRRKIDGRVHRCSLDARALRDADAWLRTYQRFWTDNLDALAAFVEDGADD